MKTIIIILFLVFGINGPVMAQFACPSRTAVQGQNLVAQILAAECRVIAVEFELEANHVKLLNIAELLGANLSGRDLDSIKGHAEDAVFEFKQIIGRRVDLIREIYELRMLSLGQKPF